MDVPVFKLLLAATGSIAALKIPILLKTLLDQPTCVTNYKFEVYLIVTKAAKRFFKMVDVPPEVHVYDDEIASQFWHHPGDRVLHVELAEMADMLLIAPLNANTMSKIAQGMSDNLVTITIRSWPLNKPAVFCPGMNPNMWAHPITAQHIATLKKWGFIEIPPVRKKLLCGSYGIGGMAKVDTIVEFIIEFANSDHSTP